MPDDSFKEFVSDQSGALPKSRGSRKKETVINKIICCLIPLLLLGCSKKIQVAPSPALPFKVIAVKDDESKIMADIMQQARTLLAAKNYDQLDALAAKLRSSKECFADGDWKLEGFYYGLNLSDASSDDKWEARLTELRDWVAAKPNSITAWVALANDLTGYAWKARGSGHASGVTTGGWRLFEERLQGAAKTLDEAKLLNEKCPFFWSVTMTLALGSQMPKSQFDDVFHQAIKADPDYMQHYYQRAWFLFPRWYGSPGEWESDLKKSADMIGGDDGDVLYARIVWNANQLIGFKNIFQENNLSWPRVKRGLEILEKRFPDSLALKSEGAKLAVLGHDQQAGRKYFDLTQGKMDICIWDDQDEFLHFANYIYTH